MPESHPPHPACFGPYLRYAIDTEFKYFKPTSPDVRIALLVELRPHVSAQKFFDAIHRARPPLRGDAIVGPTEDDAPYVSVRGGQEIVCDARWRALWDALALRVALTMPVHSVVDLLEVMPSLKYDKQRPRSQAHTVIAIIDDGCAFAHPCLRKLGLGSRVFALWDQQSRPPIDIMTPTGPQRFGRLLPDFQYGLEFWRDDAFQDGPQPVIGIDAWTRRFANAAGHVDEADCYAEAGFASLRRRATHGSHVLDLLAGRIPVSARISLDRETPPSFAPTDDVASRADTDIVFVQIPRDAIEDASGLWLEDHVTQGLRYIVSCLKPGTTKQLIVNLSYGPTTGPHNGTAVLEGVMAAMADFYDGELREPCLQVVLPSGNSRRSNAHVAFESTETKRHAEWTWRIPPANPVPVFAEVWVEAAQAGTITGELVAPGDYVGEVPTLEVVTTAQDCCWLLVVPPTMGAQAALHGDWTIKVDISAPGVTLHAYAARTSPNMGARPGAKDACFVDPRWQRDHGADAAQQRTPSSPAATGSLLDEAGTLNGIATGAHAHVHVAGGYQVLGHRPSRYASIGPARGGARHGPDYALPTDESPARHGMPGAGVCGGSTVRLVGTSAASPQLARRLAGPGAPLPCVPGPNQDPVFGCGPLSPP